MKKKSMIYLMLLTMLICSIAAFSQYGYDEEARKRCPETVVCTVQCWYTGSGGYPYPVNHTGTQTICNKCETIQDCNETMCNPQVPC